MSWSSSNSKSSSISSSNSSLYSSVMLMSINFPAFSFASIAARSLSSLASLAFSASLVSSSKLGSFSPGFDLLNKGGRGSALVSLTSGFIGIGSRRDLGFSLMGSMTLGFSLMGSMTLGFSFTGSGFSSLKGSSFRSLKGSCLASLIGSGLLSSTFFLASSCESRLGGSVVQKSKSSSTFFGFSSALLCGLNAGISAIGSALTTRASGFLGRVGDSFALWMICAKSGFPGCCFTLNLLSI
mmetsp:Transcript_6558/g.11493  ORF Transcript_6558/g.11493 Transcript_6558/m.11493 type:complete len:240 (+) Transcript_6558:1901-2620(+)